MSRFYLPANEGEQNPGSGVWIDQQLGVVWIGGLTPWLARRRVVAVSVSSHQAELGGSV